MTTVELFKPKGDKAQWEYVYDLMVTKQVGDVITLKEISEAVGFDVRDRRSPIYLAQRHLEQSNHRTFVPVRGVGYRIADAAEHEQIARNHQTRGRRQLVKARRKIIYVDRSKLSPEAVRRFDAIQRILTNQEQMIRRQDIRMAKIEEAIQETRQVTAKSTEELAAKQQKMMEALARHGINVDLDDQAGADEQQPS